MRTAFLVMILGLVSFSPALADSPSPIPKGLDEQITRLTALVRDGFTQEDPSQRKVQCLRAGSEDLCLVVFTTTVIMANGWAQQLAVFQVGESYEGGPFYHFVDRAYLTGKGAGVVESLGATITERRRGQLLITIPTMVNATTDLENFPSRQGTLKFILENGRLREAARK